VRVGIDARELAGKPTGVGRYLAEILKAWVDLPEAARHEFVLCAPADLDTRDYAGLRLSTAVQAGVGTAWEQTILPGLLHRNRAEVLFAPAYTSPLRSPVPVVLTIHDVSFAAHPEWFSWREGARRRVVTRLSAERARRILTVSEFSKREIVAHLGVDPGRVEVIYSGVPGLPASGAGSSAVSAASRSVLYVGSIFNRRHVTELIEGFGQLARRHPDVILDIVGDNRTSPPIDLMPVVARTGAAERVRVRAYVGDDDLAGLYRRAGAFAFLSEYEGFGFTPLEALGKGVPVLVLDTRIAREIYGDAALYVTRADPRLIADGLERLLFDVSERSGRLGAAREILARYSWTDAARRVLAALVDA
jgi:glycosyltransferase involved in cell wall biosynthesis